ncbi:MAG: DUF6883 domain-containing protein [Terriglobia bacterium]
MLNPGHARGRHKARVFASALGIRQEDTGLLRQALLEAAASAEVVLGDKDDYLLDQQKDKGRAFPEAWPLGVDSKDRCPKMTVGDERFGGHEYRYQERKPSSLTWEEQACTLGVGPCS